MSSLPSESDTWSKSRFWLYVALVMGIQVVLIWRYSASSEPWPRPAPVGRKSKLLDFDHLDPSAREILALTDPTVFALPGEHGFSGSAWLRQDPPVHPIKEWSDTPQWLAQDVGRLGGSFRSFAQTNRRAVLDLAQALPPELGRLGLATGSYTTNRSTLRVEIEGPARRLVATPSLPAMSHSEMLSNSVVQVMVTPDGRTFSATLQSASGSAAADQYAVKASKEMRFEPIGRKKGEASQRPEAFSWARLIFEWVTLPLTNRPSSNL